MPAGAQGSLVVGGIRLADSKSDAAADRLAALQEIELTCSDPFEQIDVSTKRSRGGLGLGLSIARRLAQAMGGDIELDTQPGYGSRFVVHINVPSAGAAARGTVTTAADGELASREILCVG